VPGTIARFDWDVAVALRSFADANSWLTLPVIVITAVAIIGSLATPALLAIRRPRWRGPLAGYVAAAVAYVAADLVGAPWHRPRPFVALHVKPLFPHGANTSFPSGTIAVVAAVACVAWLAWPALGRVLAIATVVAAFGCVYVDVHWPSDVAAGAALGVADGWLCWLVISRALPRTLRPHAAPPDTPHRTIPTRATPGQ
jgi:membrane-associated phospholipid phosphatase